MTNQDATPNGAPVQQVVPTGRAEVMTAVLDSAGELFAERGPAAASIRDIAVRARVNHGLVFHYFGTKEKLVAAVLNHLGAHVTALIDADAPADEIQAASARQVRVMARAVLDGFAVEKLQTSFPGVERLLDQVRPLHSDDDAARLAAAHVVGLLFAWQLFEPFLRSATGLRDLPDDKLRQSIGIQMAKLSQPD